jgi:putative phosphoesterase
LISDTHGFFEPRLKEHLQECDEIWHAGDIGDLSVMTKLRKLANVRAVYGNIDGQEVRTKFPKNLKFTINGVKVWITHIGGYPGNYTKEIKHEIYRLKPDLFISGHSHILKVLRDKKLPSLLHMNPGAAGKNGFHKIKTILTFEIQSGKIFNVNAIELGPRAEGIKI